MNNYYQIIDGTTMYYPEYVEKLQEENKDLKEQLKGTTHCYDEEEHKRLLEENKKLKQHLVVPKNTLLKTLEDYKDYYIDATKNEILNDTYIDYCAYLNIVHILTEFENWLKKRLSIKPMFTTYFFEMDGRKTSITEIEEKELSVVLDKLKELKGTNDDSHK